MIHSFYPSRYDLPWDPVMKHLCCELSPAWPGRPLSRVNAVRRFQFEPVCFLFPDRGWAWGDMSPSSLNWSLCVLDRFLGLRDAPARWQGRWIACSPRAVTMAQGFCAEIVSQIPVWGGTVSGDVIRAWIDLHSREWTEEGIDLTQTDPLPDAAVPGDFIV